MSTIEYYRILLSTNEYYRAEVAMADVFLIFWASHVVCFVLSIVFDVLVVSVVLVVSLSSW